ncbi:MAG: FHA domain-containing protein [Ruminococcus sp.]|nr:FHA domain-containing protein [Ruminococcus sp.]
MYEEILEGLRNSTIFSIIVSAVVVFMVLICVFMIFSLAKEEKAIEERRWEKVSGRMELIDKKTGEHIPLEADEILIGRHGAADIRFPDMSISRYHAVLYVSNGVWRVLDLGSTSGTYVNNKKISSQVILKNQDEIQFGTQAVIIREKGRRRRNVS